MSLVNRCMDLYTLNDFLISASEDRSMPDLDPDFIEHSVQGKSIFHLFLGILLHVHARGYTRHNSLTLVSLGVKSI